MPEMFEHVIPNPDQVEELAKVRAAFKTQLLFLDTLLPAGRYRALAMTALEEAAMWANKAITHTNEVQR